MTSSEVKVGPVGPLSRRAALRLIADCVGAPPARSVETLGKLYRSRRRAAGAVFWQARHGGRCVAAAMVVPNPGRFGMLLYSPPGAAGVDASALSTLLRLVAGEACRKGLAFVQSLVLPEARAETAVLASAGLVPLARLLYMRLDLLGREAADAGRPDCEPIEPGAAEGEWSWRPYDQFDESELCRAIAATYAGSLDCPALSGVRSMSDVVAGHKASGTFRPSSWWLVERCGRPAGCILVNGSPMAHVAEVVYVGVLPEFRGRRLGRALLRRAVLQARERKDYAVTLAVDSRNACALGLYESAGFRQVFARLAYISSPNLRPEGHNVESV